MMTLTKTALTTLTLILLNISILAQTPQKYEFMTITYYEVLKYRDIRISIDGKEFLKEEVTLDKSNREFFNTNPLLTKTKEYQDKGWEVISFNSISSGSNERYWHIAYLRRKKD